MSAYSLPRVVIAAPMSGSGKTTVVAGLLSALRRRGLKAQSFKIGPDYIDPGYHALASGRPAHNLDTWLVPKERLANIFESAAKDADISIIEGVMGLFDGGKNGVSSTAEIAKLLNAPVLLVINGKSMGESAAAVAMGFRQYDPDVNFAGVILNRLGSDNHREMIEEALARLEIPVFGAIRRNDAVTMPERHLGLVPVEENNREREIIDALGRVMDASLDIDKIIALGKSAPPLEIKETESSPYAPDIKIAIARDEAFSFYYPESLAALKRLGAELVFFSPLNDKVLPKADGLILGGGFPEMFAERLFENKAMRDSIRSAANEGLPIYAECGGFMYLMRQMTDLEGNVFKMLGVIPGDVIMNKKLQTVGYVSAEMERDTVLGPKGTVLKGHEFHFSSECVSPEDENYPRAFTFRKTRNPVPYPAGYAKGNILGSYLHIHFAGEIKAAKCFVSACRKFSGKAAH